MVNLNKLVNTPVFDTLPTDHRPEGAVDFTSEHERMIDELIVLRSHVSFVESLYEWGESKGWLTETQDAKLRQIYEEAA